MPRRNRIHLQGAIHHVIYRGNNKQQIFFSPEDCCRAALLLQEGIERFHHKILGFCFMTNHVHMVIEAGKEPISRGMQNFSFRYTKRINRKFNNSGHLFQGRYRSILVDSENYLGALMRYVHLNPVRAGIVTLPGQHL